MIGILLYVPASRHDVMQVAGLVARFQSVPKESHVMVVQIILKYLKGTMDFGLWYQKGDNFTLTKCIDANWEGSFDENKITSGGEVLLGSCLVSDAAFLNPQVGRSRA